MIKNCIIYKFLDEAKDAWKIDKGRFSKSSLEDCLQEASGFARKRIEAFTSLVQNERISLEEETQTHHIITFSCEFRTHKLIAAGDLPPFVPVSFKIWLRKESQFAASFDAGRKLSGAAMALLSYATTGTPSLIEHIKLTKEDFLELKGWILSDNHPIPGGIRGVALHDIEEGAIKFKQIVLNSPQLEGSPLFNRLLDSASAIANLSFITPPLNSTNRPLSCRINYWGGLTIYTPNLLDSEIAELIRVFEKLI
jgi:hypothetical protein